VKIAKKPIVRTFQIEGDDKDDIIEVTVRQARAGDNLKRADLFSETSQVFYDEGSGKPRELKQKWNIQDQKRYEAYLTVVDITGIEVAAENKKGEEVVEPLFRSKETPDGIVMDMDQASFYKAWSILPQSMATKIHKEAVLKMNPDWDPEQAGE
jgi:hypothetical protein